MQEAENVVDMWLNCPHDELIPLMKNAFDYGIRVVLFALYDFKSDDQQLVTSIHNTYNIVSVLLLPTSQTLINYLLNTQLVQDIIKNMYTHRNEKKDTKHSAKKHTHIKHYKI